MNYIDIILLAILVVCTYLSARRGLFHVLSQYLASIAAFFLARLLCDPAASFIYSHYVAQQVQTKLNEILPGGSVSGQLASLSDTVQQALPDVVEKIVSQFRLTELLHTGTSQAEMLTVSELETLYVAPIVTKAISILTMFILFILLAVILKTAVYYLNKALFGHKDSKFQGVNKFLGAMLGIARGVLLLLVIAFLMNVTASFLSENPFHTAVASSYICNYVSTIIS